MKMRFFNRVGNISIHVFVLISGLSAGSVTAQAQKANFTGNWQLDQGRTELGNVPASAVAVSIQVDQQKDSIFIERAGGSHVHERLPMAGTPTSLPFSGGNKLASIRFVDNGTKMEESATYTLDSIGKLHINYPTKSMETWALLDNNHALQITRTVETVNHSSYSIKAVYTKQD